MRPAGIISYLALTFGLVKLAHFGTSIKRRPRSQTLTQENVDSEDGLAPGT